MVQTFLHQLNNFSLLHYVLACALGGKFVECRRLVVMSQVAVCASLTMQLVLEIIARDLKHHRVENDGVHLQRVNVIGEKVGYQLSERLLHREKKCFFTPEQMVIFVASSLWQSLFGRSVCYACIENTQYILRDEDFIISQNSGGFSNLPLLETKHKFDENSTFSISSENSPFLVFLAGVIRGSLLSLLPYTVPSVSCKLSNEKVLSVLVNFN